MFLVLKRFPMDDVPIVLLRTKAGALTRICIDVVKNKYATKKQRDLMQCDIGCAFCDAYLIVEFDDTGEPISSQIINTGD